MNVEDSSYSANAPTRSNHYLLLQRSIKRLIIGKSDCGKTTLLNNLFQRDGWLRLQSIVRLRIIASPTYLPAVGASAGKKLPYRRYPRPPTVQGKSPFSLIDVVNTLLPPRHPSIDTFFFEQGSDVLDPRVLDHSRKNLMVNLMVFYDVEKTEHV